MRSGHPSGGAASRVYSARVRTKVGSRSVPERMTRLYGIPLSHPVLAARAMLERKEVPYRYVELLAGAHPLALRGLGFRTVTVPAMKLSDGRRVQGSLAIDQALEAAFPEPSLY